ncbi:hypothetical protein MTO98_16365 [Mucilaginibacter sp. SMC90]|uniref:hypothetical protein n=1 Tax=Mucilaginibacter sp. SMC90 TaxID=2929803 RepID=UPI001FB27625|nr:hypothetical protein [Mucilaginibacter sp. SMC90]UOE52646.1 hypothetical protein MTO98_16365 [Mucilaginibacter sp. SMC90]
MGQLLRLHFENKDHSFRILNNGPVTRATTEIDLLLGSAAHTIIKSGQSWQWKDPAGEVPAELVQAIAKAIILRFCI